MTIHISDIDDLPRAASEFVEGMGSARHFAFHGPMGAGKTTFISALCDRLGSLDEASSPTFSIVNEYEIDGKKKVESGDKIYHFDFYRVDTAEELLDMGLDDYWDSGNICMIEWPENAEGFLPEDIVNVEIRVAPDQTRVIEI